MTAAADGSSLANPGPSGWAWYIDDAHWAAGGWPKGTNNMGELMSVLDLLRATRTTDQPLRILCDSQYAINCCTRWIPAWKKRGWRKADNQPVANLDLLRQLDVELAGRDLTFQWVRGHAGHPLNERADQLARAAATAYQTGRPLDAGPGFGAAPIPEVGVSPATDPSTLSQPTTPAWSDPTPLDSDSPDPVLPEPPAQLTSLRPGQPDLLSVPDLTARQPTPAGSLVVELTDLTRQVVSADPLTDRRRLDDLMHPECVVHLPGGSIRTKGAILARPLPAGGQVQLDVIGADQLADDVVLLRYRLTRQAADYVCAAVWTRAGGVWRLRFQQVTPSP